MFGLRNKISISCWQLPPFPYQPTHFTYTFIERELEVISHISVSFPTTHTQSRLKRCRRKFCGLPSCCAIMPRTTQNHMKSEKTEYNMEPGTNLVGNWNTKLAGGMKNSNVSMLLYDNIPESFKKRGNSHNMYLAISWISKVQSQNGLFSEESFGHWLHTKDLPTERNIESTKLLLWWNLSWSGSK